MSQQNPTIIVGHLDDSELTKSIDKLVNEVATKTTAMAGHFTTAIGKMQDAMKDFAITQKVSVDLMKEAWRDMSESFDAMVAAQSGATGGGKGSGKAYAPNTLGELEQNIAKIKQERKEMELNSDELRTQNALLERRKNLYKEQTTSPATRNLNAVMGMQPKSLGDSERQLKLLEFLQRRYAGTTELSVAQQNRLARAIQKTKEQIDKLKPKSLNDVLGMDANSIDQIAAKLRALKMVRIDPNNAAEVKRVGDAYAELKRKQAQLMGQNIQLTHSNNYLAQSFGYIRNRIVYALTLGAITNFVKQLYEIRGQYELLERSLGVLVGSFEKGTQIFNELNEMAIKSPFTLIELGTAAKQLTAYNFAANEVVDTTRRLADISAALGVPMERLTYNLGQIKAQGVLNARDARDFANAGLAIVPMLAKMYTEQKTFGDEMVTTAQVYDMMSKKMVTYSDVLKVLYKVTDEGGKFFDFQAKQADTLRVQMANLTLAYNNMLNEIGSENQGILSGMVGGLKTLLKNWREISRAILTLVTTLGTYKAVAAIVSALNSRMFVGGILVNLRNYILGIKNATGAMATFNAVTKMNPIGFLVSALAAAVGYFVLFDNSVSEASEIVEQFGESGAKSLKKIDTLQKVLNGTSKTSSVYKKTLEELSTITSEYGVQLDKENAKRSDINKAIEQTIQLIKEESSERQRANQLEQARSTYESETEAARKELQETIAKSSNISGGGIDSKYLKAIKENSEAVAAIVDEVVTNNIHLIVNKSGEELEKGIDDLYGIINTRLKKVGISGGDIQQILSGLLSSTSAVEKFAISIANANEKLERRGKIIERNKQVADEATQATMTFTQKVDANARALRNNTDDAISLYNRVYDIVKIAKENHIINFDLKLSAEKPPKWMLDKSLPELQQLAEKFTAIAQSGGHAKGYDRESTYERGLMYASAARLKQEEEERNARNKDKDTRKKQSDEIAKAIKKEISLVKELQSAYDTLTKKGDSHANAIAKVQDLYGKTIDLLNKDMDKFGLPRLDLSIIKGNNHNEVLAFFEKLRDVLESKGLSNIERMEAVEGVVKEFRLKADTYNLDMITKGLNNELGKLKDEYELAVELDADPELGNAFASMMGIDMESLPHTVKEYADKYADSLNKYLKGKKSTMQLTGDELRGLTRDDINALQSQVNAGTFNQEWFDAIKKAYDDIQGKRKKDIEDTEKWKNSLIEKYGNLQDKLTKIYKDSVQNQVNAVKSFGTEDQKSDIVRLQLRLEATDNPAELTEINTEIAKIVKDVTDKNPIALKLVTASGNQTKSDVSKAYWEDFKNSDMYTMTFEDMANNSTRAIELIIDKLNGLKDHVKEDPASMKALIKSLEDAEKELNARDPFGGIARSLKNMEEASKETKDAQEALWRAEVDVEQAQQEYDNAEDGTPEERAAAQQKLADAIQKRSAAEVNLTQAENKHKKAQENLKSSLQGVTGQLGNVKSLFDTVSSLFRAGGDDKTADAIDAISEGFSIMTTVIMGVVAAMVLLESSQPWLLAIAAALSVIVGLVKFLSGNDNEKIDKEVKESERAVKRLELAYVDLQQAVDKAMGTAVIGAKQATIANKELQLAEIKRQIQLEKSRKSKDRDEDKIIDLQKQYKELFYEIQNGYTELVDDLMGTDASSFAENLVSSMIDAFKQGEDYMKVFNEKFDEMIDNIIMKSIVSRVVSSYLNKIWDDVDKRIKERSKKEAEDYADKQNTASQVNAMSDNEIRQAIAASRSDGSVSVWEWKELLDNVTQKDIDEYRRAAEAEEKAAKERLDAASEFTDSDIDYVLSKITEVTPELGEKLKNILSEYYKFGENSDKNLSSLQQGLQSMSEDTGSALESYMNGVSQQVYYHSSLLEQIRDSVVGLDLDVSLGVQSQMLLQLQNSYQTQQAIQQILEGVLVPSGRAFAVELLS